MKLIWRKIHYEGNFDLYGTPITNLGNLQSVGGYLDLQDTPITNLGNLREVGRDIDLRNTPISRTMSEEEIRAKVKVEGRIFL